MIDYGTTTVYVPITVTTNESFWETGFGTTITITRFISLNLVTAARTVAIPTGGAGFMPPAIVSIRPASINVTQLLQTGNFGPLAWPNITAPSLNSLSVLSLRLNRSATLTATGSFRLPITSSLSAQSTTFRNTNTPPVTPSYTSSPGAAAVKNGSAIELVLITALIITGSLISLF